jgi:hypothetical protein
MEEVVVNQGESLEQYRDKTPIVFNVEGQRMLGVKIEKFEVSVLYRSRICKKNEIPRAEQGTIRLLEYKLNNPTIWITAIRVYSEERDEWNRKLNEFGITA